MRIAKDTVDNFLSEVFRLVKSNEFLVVVNGLPKRYNNSYVYVKAIQVKREVEFFTKYRTGGRSFQHIPAHLKEDILEDILNGELFGYDFSDWVAQQEATQGKSMTYVTVNASLRMLFIETPMYRLFKGFIPKQTHLNVQFFPRLNNGEELRQDQIVEVLNRMRIQGFDSMLELDRTGLSNRISLHVPKFYKVGDAFTLSALKINEVYNPLFDDQNLIEQIKGLKLFKMIRSRSVHFEQLRAEATYLSNAHISEAFNLKQLLPFNYPILVRLFAGFVMDPRWLPISYPNKNLTVMRQANVEELSENFPRVLSIQDFNAASDFQKSFYGRSNSMRAFLLENSAYFQSKGFRDVMRLIEIFEEAILV